MRFVSVESAYLLFSQRKMKGSFQTEARFMVSWTTPWLAPPSPKNVSATRSVPWIFAASEAPAPIGTPAATMPLHPRMLRSSAAMCIEPPRPRQYPSSRPISSAIMRSIRAPLAIVWPWPRWFETMKSSSRRLAQAPAATASWPT